jgi:NAD(P)-dependent dehydrogenase (short-subunit alcohol dehydrogenase family)
MFHPKRIAMIKTLETMHGKICVITGGNSGIGKFTALGLAALDATLILICRDRQRAAAAREEIIRETGNDNIEFFIADLTNQQSIRSVVDEILSVYTNLHVLINNAGVHHLERHETSDGLEATFAVNYLAPFLLTSLFLDTLKKSAPSRIINVSSRLIQNAHIDFDDLQLVHDYPILKTGALAYCQSKLALTLYTYELAKRLQGTKVTVNCYCPGWTRTGLMEGEPRPLSHRLLSLVFAHKASVGAHTGIFLASAVALQDVSGRFFENCLETPSFQSCYDPAIASQLWDVSEALTHLQKEI